MFLVNNFAKGEQFHAVLRYKNSQIIQILNIYIYDTGTLFRIYFEVNMTVTYLHPAAYYIS